MTVQDCSKMISFRYLGNTDPRMTQTQGLKSLGALSHYHLYCFRCIIANKTM